MTTTQTARSTGRDPYYHAVFEAFLGYIADGEPFAVRTTTLNGFTDVTLRFKSEAFAKYVAHLPAFTEAP